MKFRVKPELCSAQKMAWSRGGYQVCAQAPNIAAAYFLSCRVQSAEHVARRQLA